MAPKLLVAAVAVIAIVVGYMLPGPHADEAQAHSQAQLQEIGRT